VAELEKTIQEYIKMEHDVKNHITALGEIKNRLANGEVEHASLGEMAIK
jgi:hypothetical protein